MSMIASAETLPLLAELLAEQQRLDTPVARFSAAHELRSHLALKIPPADLHYSPRQLIPLTAPGPGEQYAFEVDLDSCTGCKACVAACHSLNGLDDDETWRDVGQLVSADRRHPFSQTITTACHHCEDPACLNGCPVLAYEKDPVTGIVRHLDDQCIGCSYCILKCPYDVPKFSKRRGIVRKCDLCHDRLAHDEAPACAQACPTEAIRIVVSRTADSGLHKDKPPESGAVGYLKREHAGRQHSEIENQISDIDGRADQSAIRTPPSTLSFLPGAPDPAYTRPTTRYVTKRGLPPNVAPADAAALRPQPAHWPLVVLLILMALATGCSVVAAITSIDAISVHPSGESITYHVTFIGWAAGAAGMLGSVLHLGQPRRAWRIFLGLRRSWLSREAVVFGIWFVLASLLVFTPSGAGAAKPGALFGEPPHRVLAATTAVVAIAGLFCSAMIYADTRRELWQIRHTGPRFLGSAVVLGLACTLACDAGVPGSPARMIAGVLVVAMMLKLAIESHALAALNGDRDTLTPALKTARLLIGPLRSTNELRIACAIVGGILLPVLIATHTAPGWLAGFGLVATLAGELLERSLYFRAVVAPKMPGVPE